MIPQILLIALSTFASEDLTCVATGALISRGRISFLGGTLACFLGIFIGDLLLFLGGRLAGRRAFRWPPVCRLAPPERVDQASEWLAARGLPVVFLSRFTPGLRLPVYFAAGLLSTPFRSFAGYLLLACAVWTPLVVGATVLLGENLIRAAFSHGGQEIPALIVACGMGIAAIRLTRSLFVFSARQRLLGFLKRKIQWEFWPAWAAYIPLIPYLFVLAVRHRSLTLFTAANPGIFSGGLLGESKSRMLAYLSRIEGVVPEYEVIPGGLGSNRRLPVAQAFMAGNRLTFPVVLKPDVGERGRGVVIARSGSEMESYLSESSEDTIIQRYVEGLEFGVFYYRLPGAPKGKIFSITAKHFPAVTGDARTSLEDLILKDSRAVCLAATYIKRVRARAGSVPTAGEVVRLAEIGSHCRGAVFLDASGLKTSALEDAIDEISRAHPGFYFGRFDIRVPSIAAFQQGRELSVIELNGVAAEATHIYDPSVSLLEAYRVLFTQWRIAFEIGAINRKLGSRPLPLKQLAALVWNRFGIRISSKIPVVSEYNFPKLFRR